MGFYRRISSNLRPLGLPKGVFLFGFLFSVLILQPPFSTAFPFTVASEALFFEALKEKNRIDSFPFHSENIQGEPDRRFPGTVEDHLERPSKFDFDQMGNRQFLQISRELGFQYLDAGNDNPVEKGFRPSDETAFGWLFPLFSRHMATVLDKMAGVSASEPGNFEFHRDKSGITEEVPADADYPETSSGDSAPDSVKGGEDWRGAPDYSYLFAGRITPVRELPRDDMPPIASGIFVVALLLILIPDLLAYFRDRSK
jgi:hypothetical protein